MLSAPRDDELYQKGGVVYFKVHFEYTSQKQPQEASEFIRM